MKELARLPGGRRRHGTESSDHLELGEYPAAAEEPGHVGTDLLLDRDQPVIHPERNGAVAATRALGVEVEGPWRHELVTARLRTSQRGLAGGWAGRWPCVRARRAWGWVAVSAGRCGACLDPGGAFDAPLDKLGDAALVHLLQLPE